MLDQRDGDPLFCEGANCVALARCKRLSFLIDGQQYFEALIEALPKAERRIMMVGWDFDARTPLRPHLAPNDPTSPKAFPLGEFLRGLIHARPELELYVLIWRNSIFYGSNPIPVPTGSEWWQHPRIHFKLDDHHPLGASHHQKIVCIDGKVAFMGGMDLTQGRWDDTRHLPDQPGRVDTFSKPYNPVHDLQVVVDGEIACAVCSLAEHRWRYAAGEYLPPVSSPGDPWPTSVAPAVTDQQVALARTQPAYGEQPEAREIERLNAAFLQAANDYIYLETQYFSLPGITDILVRHLQRPDGPEIIIVVTKRSNGLIEQYVMAENRDRLFAYLRGADKYGRLRAYYPVSCPSPECEIKIHSKLLIADDRLLKIGSSNMNARSTGLDTECDLAMHAERRDAIAAVRRLRDTLIGEHVGVDAETFAKTLERGGGSLIVAIEALGRGDRRLIPYHAGERAGGVSLTPGSSILDPDQPLDIGYVLGKITNP
ncbi:MAG TPA: phospholipase D-like domain-containing protein [Alphaproteobacteria bacterium]|jgi:phosphatidylserine/phosphatidylglycerophosphate/cardiolipin synthase-like enzyme|nr:phospholipase D-like domain-containing protein [Alphaproteobacteria bacterium]